MNHLPDARRAIHGRTWSSCWSASSMDPIDRPAPRTLERFADRALAVCLGIALALLALKWFST